MGLVCSAFLAAGGAWLRTRDKGASVLSAGALAGATLVAAGLATGAALYLAPGAPYFWCAIATAMRLPEVLQAERDAKPARSTEPARRARAVY